MSTLEKLRAMQPAIRTQAISEKVIHTSYAVSLGSTCIVTCLQLMMCGACFWFVCQLRYLCWVSL